jgi:hypothetical protein
MTATTPIRLILGGGSHRSFVLHPEAKILQPVALLRTCKKICNKSLEIYYSSNSFQFDTESPDDQVARFLMTLGEKTSSLLRSVTIFCTPIFRYRNRRVEKRQQKSLIQWMIRLRKVASYRPSCSIKYKIEMESFRTALHLQGLSPYLMCDLKDLGDPWTAQDDARDRQCHIWLQGGGHAIVIMRRPWLTVSIHLSGLETDACCK